MSCENCICHLDPMGICQHTRAKLNKRKTKVLFVDVDDTLIYWFPHYLQWLFKNKFDSGADFDTHDVLKMVQPDMYMDFNLSLEFVENRKVIQPIFKFVKNCFFRGVEIVFVSSCGQQAGFNQRLSLSKVFEKTDVQYKTVIFNTSQEKIDYINNIVTKQDINAMLLDDKRETCESVECIATDSKNIEELVNLANIALHI